MIATDGKTTVVDHNNYNLTIDQAVKKLIDDEKIIAIECPDYSQEELYSVYPGPVVLNGNDYREMDYTEMFESLRSYDQFGDYFQNY